MANTIPFQDAFNPDTVLSTQITGYEEDLPPERGLGRGGYQSSATQNTPQVRMTRIAEEAIIRGDKAALAVVRRLGYNFRRPSSKGLNSLVCAENTEAKGSSYR